MKTAFVNALAAAVILGAMAGTGGAQDPVQKIQPLTKEDFVSKAIACAVADQKLSEKAARDASSEDVRRLGQKLADEHKKANDRLMDVAKEMKLAVVQGFDKNSKEIYDRISGLSGEQFDREYVKHVLKSHTEAISMFESQMPANADVQLKGVSNEVLPKLRDHLKEAREVAERLKIEPGK